MSVGFLDSVGGGRASVPAVTDAMIRRSWKIGSHVEVYSSTSQRWYEGDIARIFHDEEGEWLEVHYNVGTAIRLKQCPRDDFSAIRPCAASFTQDATSASLDHIAIKSSSSAAGSTMRSSMDMIGGSTSMDTTGMSEADIRASWVRGSHVEVYSQTKRKWLKGIIHRVFVDEEGEWLEVKYNMKYSKQVPRNSVDLRPVSKVFNSAIISLTSLHADLVSQLWEKIDFENTRYLDSSQFQLLLNSLNTGLNSDECDEAFRSIDSQADVINEAINSTQFLTWLMQVSCSEKELEIKERIYIGLDRTTKGEAKLVSVKEFKETQQRLVRTYGDEAVKKSHATEGKARATPVKRKRGAVLQSTKKKAKQQQQSGGVDSLSAGMMLTSSPIKEEAEDEDDDGFVLVSKFTPAKPSAETIARINEELRQHAQKFLRASGMGEYGEDEEDEEDEDAADDADDENEDGISSVTVTTEFSDRPGDADEDALSDLEDLKTDETGGSSVGTSTQDEEYRPPPDMAKNDGPEFSDFDDDCDEEARDYVPELIGSSEAMSGVVSGSSTDPSSPASPSKGTAAVTMTLQQKLDRLGLMGSYMICTSKDDMYGYQSPLSLEEFEEIGGRHSSDSTFRGIWRDIKDMQHYIMTRVNIAGLEGIRVSDLGTFVGQKFGEKYSRMKKKCQIKLTDLVYFSRGVEVLEFDEDPSASDTSDAINRLKSGGGDIASIKRDIGMGGGRAKKAGPPGVNRFAVTSQTAMKMNLKQKVSFVISMLFDKARVSNDLTLLVGATPKGYGMSGKARRTAIQPSTKAARKMSVGEKLLTLEDFVLRFRSLGLDESMISKLEMDELFWSIAGCNGHLLSRRGIASFFAECVDYIHFESDVVECDVVKIIPKLIDYARLTYRRQSIWSKYIVHRLISQWNDVMYVSLVDRQSRSHEMKALIIPKNKTNRIHSFHTMCHILNKVQYPTVVTKVEHGRDRFDLLCVCKKTEYTFSDLIELRIPEVSTSSSSASTISTSMSATMSSAAMKGSPSPPPSSSKRHGGGGAGKSKSRGKGKKKKKNRGGSKLPPKIWRKKSDPVAVAEAAASTEPITILQKKGVVYSEWFISQIIGSVCETITFLHKHGCVNMNLNVDAIGFDSSLRPVLLDFTRVVMFENDDEKTDVLYSVMSSTPPELALLMGQNGSGVGGDSDSDEDSDFGDEMDTPPLISVELCGPVLRKCDAWRVGVLLYTLLSGQLPFKGSSLNNFITCILTSSPSIAIDDLHCTKSCKNLLKRLLDTAYFNRLSIPDALKHPWFKIAPKTPLVIHQGSTAHGIGLASLSSSSSPAPPCCEAAGFEDHSHKHGSLESAAARLGALPASHQKLQSLFRLESARNWISAVIHEETEKRRRIRRQLRSEKKKAAAASAAAATTAETVVSSSVEGTTSFKIGGVTSSLTWMEELELRDKKYYGRLDRSGQRKTLKQTQLKQFIVDRLHYCPYKADKIVEALWVKKKGTRGVASRWTWDELNDPYYTELRHSNSEPPIRLCNAIFKGLDPDGIGKVRIDECMSLFYDIKLQLKPVIDKLKEVRKQAKKDAASASSDDHSEPPMIHFDDILTALLMAFEDGFDISELLSVDEVVRVKKKGLTSR